jgi:ABC-type sugar transport system ATPase subunit
MAVLEVRDARKSFGTVAALQGVSLELGERELLALLA